MEFMGGTPQPGKPGMVFDMENDPYEKNDLWSQKQDVVEEHRALLEKYLNEGRSAPFMI